MMICYTTFMLINYQKDLNPEQLEVVQSGDGACLVLAGAGSGKTRTLVYRVAYLIERGIKPNNILLVTFTNKAAREMLDRVSSLLKKNPQGLWGGTFHHIGHRILRVFHSPAGLADKFSIIDKEDSKTLIKSCIGELNIDTKSKKFPKTQSLSSAFSYASNSQKPLIEVINQRMHNIPDSMKNDIIRIRDNYADKKKQQNVLDFDDLLTKWLDLLEKNKATKLRLARQFQYILVDEYQDTNRVQSQIIYHLASVHGNVLVVGDDSQSIYSFRAADVNNILDFPNHFHATKIFKLERNYRSTPEILNLANTSIKHNQKQYYKRLKSVKDSGFLPQLVTTSDGYKQASFIADTVLDLCEEGIDLNRMSVLFRAVYQIIELELELNKRGIPYQVRGGLRFFEQAHIKDVLAYLRIIYNLHDELAWKRALYLMPGIGPVMGERIWNVLRHSDSIDDLSGIEIRLTKHASESWVQLLTVLGKLSQLTENENLQSV